MKRIDGFWNLDALKPNCLKESEYSQNHFWVTIDGTKYFFKTSNFPYLELICYKIAQLLKIEAVKYDLATLKGQKGVICPDYRKAGYNYVPGYEILGNLYNDDPTFVYEMGLNSDWKDIYDSPKYILMNNLEMIWQAIEHQYTNIPSEQKVKCMYDIVSQYLFNIFTMQYDKGAQNWELEVGDNHLQLVAAFDNEGSLSFDEYSMTMSTSFADIEKSFGESLQRFWDFSSSEYHELFNEKFMLLKKIDMLAVLESIEKETGCQIPPREKGEYVRAFNNNVNKIQKIVDERKENKIGR